MSRTVSAPAPKQEHQEHSQHDQHHGERLAQPDRSARDKQPDRGDAEYRVEEPRVVGPSAVMGAGLLAVPGRAMGKQSAQLEGSADAENRSLVDARGEHIRRRRGQQVDDRSAIRPSAVMSPRTIRAGTTIGEKGGTKAAMRATVPLGLLLATISASRSRR